MYTIIGRGTVRPLERTVYRRNVYFCHVYIRGRKQPRPEYSVHVGVAVAGQMTQRRVFRISRPPLSRRAVKIYPVHIY